MSTWLLWTMLAGTTWLLASVPLGVWVGRFIRTSGPEVSEAATALLGPMAPGPSSSPVVRDGQPRVLVVDDEPSFRELLHATIGQSDLDIREAASAEEAAALLEGWEPAVIVLDIALPGLDGLSFCRRLKEERGEEAPAVVLLTGGDLSQTGARVAGADAMLRKPFSPLELVDVLERLLGRDTEGPHLREATLREERPDEQLRLYAHDLGELLARERGSRVALEHAYRQTICSLAKALEWKDAATGGHSLRVRQYALELAAAVDPALLDDQSLEAGFFLHDIGKIAIPDSILRKRGPLSGPELRVMRRHTVIGSELLSGIPLLEGEGLGVVRSHHERWDGAGYPDGLGGDAIPAGARIFAVADAIDAMTSDRPYRKALPWYVAAEEVADQSARHFDPGVVEAFRLHDSRLEGLYEEFSRKVA
jgi:response regulator RpfG family c-di-GMP phosphodiesterase